MSQDLNPSAHVHHRSFSCIRHAKDKEVDFLCCDQKPRTASAQSFTLWQQAIIEITYRDPSIIACSRHIYLCVALCAHPICVESHFQRNINWEVATTSPPFCSEPHLTHILFVKVAPGITFTSWSKNHFVVIGKPWRQVCKLHAVAARNNRDPTSSSFYFCLFATNIYGCCSSRTSCSWWIAHSTQHLPSGCNTCSKVGLDFLKWLRVKGTNKMQTEKT